MFAGFGLDAVGFVFAHKAHARVHDGLKQVMRRTVALDGSEVGAENAAFGTHLVARRADGLAVEQRPSAFKVATGNQAFHFAQALQAVGLHLAQLVHQGGHGGFGFGGIPGKDGFQVLFRKTIQTRRVSEGGGQCRANLG